MGLAVVDKTAGLRRAVDGAAVGGEIDTLAGDAGGLAEEVFAQSRVALGGFDSPIGAVVGGLIIGIADALTRQYVPALAGIEIVVPFGLILIVLLVRPQGLFGHVKVERV